MILEFSMYVYIIAEFCGGPWFLQDPENYAWLLSPDVSCLITRYLGPGTDWRLAAVAAAELGSAWAGHNICSLRCANTASLGSQLSSGPRGVNTSSDEIKWRAV